MPRSSALRRWTTLSGRNVPRDAGEALRTLREEFVDEVSNTALDVISDATNLVEFFSGGISELPIEVTLTEIDGALVAATHRDDDVGDRTI